MKQFKPLGDRVLIKPIKQEETKTKSGIIISESMTQSQKVNGEVVEIGTGIFSQSGEKIPMTVKVGDIVLYEKGQGTNERKISSV
jgi:chaperonin GroES